MNGITLSLVNDAWVATFTGPHAAEVARVFGTPTLSTAFDYRADPARVLASIEKSNPGVRVTINY